MANVKKPTKSQPTQQQKKSTKSDRWNSSNKMTAVDPKKVKWAEKF